MLRLAGLITAELAGERRFYSEKELRQDFVSAPVCLSIKSLGKTMAQALLETEPILSFAFTSRAGSISKLWTLSPFVNTTTISVFLPAD